MSIYFYWNHKDNDCTKIFHFLSEKDELSIRKELDSAFKVKIDKIVQNLKKSAFIYEGIGENDTIIFCTHGEQNEILKYRNSEKSVEGECILISESNLHLLDNKIVLAFCCSSAAVLGRKCVEPPYFCKAFIGFENDIVYDNGKAEKSRHVIYEAYKTAFAKSIIYALKNSSTVNEFTTYLQYSLRKAAVEAVMKTGDFSLNTMYAGVIAGVIAHGNRELKVFT